MTIPTKTEEFSHELKIPKERIAVLIGTRGVIKRYIERATETTLDIDSEEGHIIITGKDALKLFTAREIVRAIARGFNPETAQLLLKQEYGLEVIGLNDYASTKAELERLRGRVIGEEGKSRRTIEHLTETHISVYGKTIAILGEYAGLSMARRAIESLLSGSEHSTVYKWLEKRRRTLREER